MALVTMPSRVQSSTTLIRPANTTVYSAKSAVGINLAVSGATNPASPSPIVITTPAHGLVDGDPVTIASVGGNTNANGNFYVKVTGFSTTTFALYSDKALTQPVIGNATYTSGGTVAKVLRFQKVVRTKSGGGGVIGATLLTDQTSNTENFRLHLYSTPPTAILDGGACSCPLIADAAIYLGSFDFGAAKTEGSSTSAYANAALTNNRVNFQTSSIERDIYGVLETPAGFTPASGQKFVINLVTEQD